MKVGIIGYGNMGKALAKSLQKIMPAKNIFVCDSGKISAPAICVCKSVAALVDKSDLIILAVKPQSFADLAAELKQANLGSKLIISIMAGVSIAKISKLLCTAKVVRSMPNLPLKVGQGVTAWVATPKVTTAEKALVQKLFKACGYAIELKKENLLNSVTAISGSGPAYFFYLTEILAEAAKDFGIPKTIATEMAIQTLIGAAELLKSEKLADPAQLRQAVTSKGGTTEAALKTLADHDFANIMGKAIKAAKTRAEELSK